jgi:hypothetical protein
MSEALVREIVKSMVGESFGVGFYLIFAGITILASAIGGYAGAYFKKKGENLASKEDFENLLEQSKRIAAEVEEIKSTIGYDDWKNRENFKYRRDNIEKLTSRILEVDALSGDIRGAFDNVQSSVEIRMALQKVQLTALLYVDGLSVEYDDYINFSYESTKILSGYNVAKLERNFDISWWYAKYTENYKKQAESSYFLMQKIRSIVRSFMDN